MWCFPWEKKMYMIPKPRCRFAYFVEASCQLIPKILLLAPLVKTLKGKVCFRAGRIWALVGKERRRWGWRRFRGLLKLIRSLFTFTAVASFHRPHSVIKFTRGIGPMPFRMQLSSVLTTGCPRRHPSLEPSTTAGRHTHGSFRTVRKCSKLIIRRWC